jgi:predicted nucleotide-binding protein
MLRDVEAFVRRIGIEPIVLIDEPNKGQTVIEKFERNADVAFAIVLFSPDDLGRAATDPPSLEKHRPRQNVVLELGFFIGTLGRKNTALLVDETTSVEWENPSDYAGVIPIHYSSGSSEWHLDLMKELQAAGITFDWGKA